MVAIEVPNVEVKLLLVGKQRLPLRLVLAPLFLNVLLVFVKCTRTNTRALSDVAENGSAMSN